MTEAEIKKHIAKRIKELDKKFHDEAENERSSKKPMDYLVIGNIEGGINELTRLLVKMS